MVPYFAFPIVFIEQKKIIKKNYGQKHVLSEKYLYKIGNKKFIKKIFHVENFYWIENASFNKKKINIKNALKNVFKKNHQKNFNKALNKILIFNS